MWACDGMDDAAPWCKLRPRGLHPLDRLLVVAIRFYVATVRGRVLLTDR